MYKSKMALVAILAAGILGLSACGGSGTSSAKTSSSAAAASSSQAGTSSSAAGSSSSAGTSSTGSSSAGTSSSTASSSSTAATTFSIAKGWQDNGDSVYTPTTSGDGVTIAYEKSGASWAAVKYSMGTVAVNLGSAKKLVMKAKITDHTGTGPWTILPKFEFNDSTAHPAHECKFQVTGEEVTYEWDLSDQTLTDALQLLLFVEPDCGGTAGKLVFSEIYFSNDAVATSGTTIVGGTVSKTINTYASGDTFDVLKNFYDGGDYAYKLTPSDGALSVDYTKWGQSYSYFGNINANVGTFDYINVTLNGPVDKTLLMKLEGTDNREEMIKMTGASQNYTFSFKDKTTRTGNQAINFFAEPGSSVVSTGTITFSKIEFSNTALVAPVVEAKNEITSINAWDASYPLTSFKEDGAAVITLGKDTSGKVTATWANQTSSGWNWFGTPISGKTERGIYTHVEMKLTSSVAGTVKGKVEFDSASAIEKDVTFTDTALTQTIDFDLSSYTVAQRGSINKAIVFPFGPDAHAASGTLTVESFLLTTPVVPSTATNGYEAVGALTAQTNQDVSYGTTTTVTYTAAKTEWEMAGFALDKTVDYSTIKTIRVHIDSVTNCTKIKFKVNDSQEYNIDDLSDLTNDFVLTLTTSIDSASKAFVGMFINYGITGQAGSVTFSKIELSTQEGGQVIKNAYTGINAWDSSWAVSLYKDGGDGLYTVTNGTTNTISWTGGTTAHTDHQWSTVAAPISGDVSFMTNVKFNVTASAACKVLFKVQGTSLAVEQWATFTDTTLTQDIIVDLSAKTVADRQSINSLYIFPLAGDTGSFLDAGTLTVNSTAFCKPATPVAGTDTYDCLGGLFGPSCYSFTRGTTVKVDYTAAKGEWEAMGFALDGSVDYSTYTKLVVHIDAVTAGIKLKFKINDAQEYNIDDVSSLTNDFTLAITTAINSSLKTFVTCFVNYGVTGVAGSVTFSKLQLAK